jgi:hypothetical protein
VFPCDSAKDWISGLYGASTAEMLCGRVLCERLWETEKLRLTRSRNIQKKPEEKHISQRISLNGSSVAVWGQTWPNPPNCWWATFWSCLWSIWEFTMPFLSGDVSPSDPVAIVAQSRRGREYLPFSVCIYMSITCIYYVELQFITYIIIYPWIHLSILTCFILSYTTGSFLKIKNYVPLYFWISMSIYLDGRIRW